MSSVVQVTTADFASVVEGSQLPVVIDFAASWCGPCKMLAPTFEAVAEANKDKATFVKIDIDDAPEIAQKFGVRGVPTIAVLKNGTVVATKSGNQTQGALSAFVAPHL